jgi:ureidoglycolate hydrolase
MARKNKSAALVVPDDAIRITPGTFTVVEGFDPYAGGDRVMFRDNSWSDIMFLGTVFDFAALDYNGDGVTDTQIAMNEDAAVVLLGWAPESVFGWMLMGG